MATPEGFRLVPSELYDRMRLHCEACEAFNFPLPDLSDGRAVPTAPAPSSRKRTTPQQMGSSTSSKRPRHSEPGNTWSRPVQPPGTEPSPQSDIALRQSGTSLPEPSARFPPIPNPAKPEKKTRKAAAFDRIVRKAPRGNRWREKQLELGLNTAEEYERVIRGFLRCAQAVSERECRVELGIIETGKRLAILTKSSLQNATLQRSSSYFQLLIFLSYCEFLRQKCVSDQAIDELMQNITDSERDRKALLDAIVWIHRLIIKLVHKGWTVYRATELFFINAASMSDLVRFRGSEIFDSTVESLSGNAFVKYDYNDCLTPSYTVPGLIAAFLDSVNSTDQISLTELHDALGYQLPDLPSSVEGIYKVYPAKSAPVCPGSLEFANLTQSSFGSGSQPIQSIDSIAWTMRSQQSPASNRIHYEASTQDHWSSNPQHETSRSDQELLTGNHQSEDHLPYTMEELCMFQLLASMCVPDTALSIQFSIEGNISGLKDLFSKRLASPSEVSYSRGFSLVRWALYGGMGNYKTVQFLLNCGASVDNESFEHVWDYAYRNKCSATELDELRCITMDSLGPCKHRDWVDDQQFPLIHQIIFGRCSKPLREELDNNPSAVQLRDAMGRTALDWATARAQLPDMELLIARGSPIDSMDVSGRTTVLHAVDSHNDDALRIILEAGANPNPEVPPGLFRSSPLIAASFGGLVGMGKLLLAKGAEVNACNPEGRTALGTVASTRNVEFADILLAHGAVGHGGAFPREYDAGRLEKLPIRPSVAEFADAETEEILRNHDEELHQYDQRGGSSSQMVAYAGWGMSSSVPASHF